MDDITRMTQLYQANPIGFNAFRKKVPDIPTSVVKAFYKSQAIPELNAVPRVKHSFKITSPDNYFQVDITHLPFRSRGFDKILTAVEVPTRKAYVFPIKNMNTSSIVAALSELLESTPVKGITADFQFNAKGIRDFCTENGIELSTVVADEEHITDDGNKLGIIDSFTRTLKRRIRNYLIQHSTKDFITPLSGIVSDYNDTVHSRLGDTPNNIAASPEKIESIREAAHQHNNREATASRIKSGTRVRHVTRKGTFDKEGPRFTKDIFKVLERDGFRYRLEGAERLFKPHEIIETTQQPGPESDKAIRKAVKAVRLLRKLRAEGVDPANVVTGSRNRLRKS